MVDFCHLLFKVIILAFKKILHKEKNPLTTEAYNIPFNYPLLPSVEEAYLIIIKACGLCDLKKHCYHFEALTVQGL